MVLIQKYSIILKSNLLRLLILFAVLSFSTQVNAQVGIGTSTPKGALDIQSNNQGLVVPRVVQLSDVTDGNGNSAVNASIVYVTTTDSFCFRVNEKWFCIEEDGNGDPILVNNSAMGSLVQNPVIQETQQDSTTTKKN